MSLLDSFTERERKAKVVKLKLNDVTSHQLTKDILRENSVGAEQKPGPELMCPLQGGQ